MKCKYSIPRITAIGVATRYTAVMTHAKRREKQMITLGCVVLHRVIQSSHTILQELAAEIIWSRKCK
jgi:uncharacterized membrane protein YhfC